eukprot:2986515-Heterocapsa_arctica.AAC.1
MRTHKRPKASPEDSRGRNANASTRDVFVVRRRRRATTETRRPVVVVSCRHVRSFGEMRAIRVGKRRAQ